MRDGERERERERERGGEKERGMEGREEKVGLQQERATPLRANAGWRLLGVNARAA